jgi:hypothetical protein
MILEIFMWGFISAFGWMTAQWTVDQVKGPQDKPPVEKNINEFK